MNEMKAEMPNDVPSEESYDEVPYPGGAFRASHPCHLAMVAKLCGISAAPPAQSRVLELGSSMGSNLIPMAQDLREASFVGIDLSARQIGDGQELIKELDLPNIELRHTNIKDSGDDAGEFDYIICHGVYSWVNHDVQRAILDMGRRLLTPNGVFYVSYNTYPGWHLRALVREMMQYHVADFDTPQQKIGQARSLLDFLVKHAKTSSQAYTTLLKNEAEILKNRLDSYIYHEHLEEINEPLYFHEFVRRADAAGLRYLADAAVNTMVAQMFDDTAAEILRGAPLLKREQYMDFLRSRMFRSSLLCHPNVEPNYQINAMNLSGLHVSLHRPFASKSEQGDEVVWRHPYGQLTTQKPITEVLERISDIFPAWTPVNELRGAISSEQGKSTLLDAIMMGFIKGLFSLSIDPPTVCAKLSQKPVCSKLSQIQARLGRKVTTRKHLDFIPQPQQRLLVQHLDGTNTVKDLARMLQDEVTSGRFKVSREGQDITADDVDSLRFVKEELERLRMIAMFVG